MSWFNFDVREFKFGVVNTVCVFMDRNLYLWFLSFYYSWIKLKKKKKKERDLVTHWLFLNYRWLLYDSEDIYEIIFLIGKFYLCTCRG